MTLPTFLIIGASKSGTTSLYEYLGQHPEVFMSPVKEPMYFAYDAERPGARPWDGYPGHVIPVRDAAAYRALFDGVTGEKAVGEASPIYLESLFAPDRIREELPDVRLIVTLRQPADRAYSDWLMAVRRGFPCELDEAMAPDEHRVQVGFYHRLLTRYYERFPAERIKVLIFEEWRRDPIPALRGIFEFIGVDPDFVPRIERRHNVGGLPRRQWLHKLLLKPTPLRRALRNHAPGPLRRWGRWLYYRNLEPQGPMPAAARRKLTELYRPDVLALQELLGKDLSGWLAERVPSPRPAAR